MFVLTTNPAFRVTHLDSALEEWCFLGECYTWFGERWRLEGARSRRRKTSRSAACNVPPLGQQELIRRITAGSSANPPDACLPHTFGEWGEPAGAANVANPQHDQHVVSAGFWSGRHPPGRQDVLDRLAGGGTASAATRPATGLARTSATPAEWTFADGTRPTTRSAACHSNSRRTSRGKCEAGFSAKRIATRDLGVRFSRTTSPGSPKEVAPPGRVERADRRHPPEPPHNEAKRRPCRPRGPHGPTTILRCIIIQRCCINHGSPAASITSASFPPSVRQPGPIPRAHPGQWRVKLAAIVQSPELEGIS